MQNDLKCYVKLSDVYATSPNSVNARDMGDWNYTTGEIKDLENDGPNRIAGKSSVSSHVKSALQGRPNSPPATPIESRKTSGTKIRKLGVKIYLFCFEWK